LSIYLENATILDNNPAEAIQKAALLPDNQRTERAVKPGPVSLGGRVAR
jgi:hypothetical protein